MKGSVVDYLSPPYRCPFSCRPSCLPVVLALSSLLTFCAWAFPAPQDERATAANMKAPPDAYRMTAWWLWFGPAVTKEEVLRELTEMHRAGLGGVTIYPTYPHQIDDPAAGTRNLRFLSAEYLEVYRYAVAVAKSLGMTVDVVGGSGWPFGGPSVGLDDAARALRLENHKLEAGHIGQVASLKGGEKLLRAFVTTRGASAWRDITAFCTAGGVLSHPLDIGGDTMAVISTPTGMRVKRPSWGGEGYVLDHLSAGAFSRYAEGVLSKLKPPSGDLRAVFADSMEVYGSDWTDHFPDEFQRRRGYDLQPLFPLLFEDADIRSADIRFDFWETVADLFVDGFVRPLHDWAAAHETKSEVQAYGVPAVPQRSYADVDIPAGEQYDWKQFTEGRWASSAAHFYGKKRVQAEFATWAGIPNRFTDTLDDLKLVADLQFLTGMTQLAASTLPYSPPSAGIPGWQDYAGAAFGLNQSWWPFLPNLTTYVQRACYILEQGRPRSDVLVYLPVEDVEAGAQLGSLHTVFDIRDRLAQANQEIPEFGLKNALTYRTPLLETVLSHGYTFDGISGDILEARGTVRGGRLGVGDGSYAAIVLPRLAGMRLGALQRIAEFVRAGGTLIAVGRLPERVYGGTQPQADSERLRALIAEMVAGRRDRYAEHHYGAGLGIFVEDEAGLTRALVRAAAPDFLLQKPDPDVGFIHRSATISPATEAEYYFVVNTSQESKDLSASFRVPHQKPELWNLEDGSTAHPAAYRFDGDRTALDLHLGPHHSRVVYFGASSELSPVAATNLVAPVVEDGWVSSVVSQPGRYSVETVSGRQEQAVTSLSDPLTVTGPWRLQFGLPLNLSTTVSALSSWTEKPEAKYFSGSASYSTTFMLPASYMGQDRVFWLDLGDVRYAARVWLNGERVGDGWQQPFRIEVSRWLKPGRNELKIDVANLLINCLLGQKPPDFSKLIAAYGDRFPYPQDWKVNPAPWPAGLLGPVQLVAGVRLRFSVH